MLVHSWHRPESCSTVLRRRPLRQCATCWLCLLPRVPVPEHVVKLNIYLVIGVDALVHMPRRNQCGVIIERPPMPAAAVGGEEMARTPRLGRTRRQVPMASDN